jgi:hypothetical protein
MGLLVSALPAARRDPDAEGEIPRHVEYEHEQVPPGLCLEVEVRLVLDVHPDEVEAARQRQDEDPRNALGDHEEDHCGHPTSGAAA